VMHRNTFINSPKLLNADFSLKSNPKIFFAGQITGVEGYTESAASGILAGINAVLAMRGKKTLILSKLTMLGSLANYISDESVKDFQPMGANMGVLPPLDVNIRDKAEKYLALANRGMAALEQDIKNMEIDL
ncbi:MAG: FAD-dependent oxidoreductase, partial [Oscillospiraceae bacterium]|nr:FAD-dependent oxidoreductase [Oscillospiraceae bacterium]